MRVEGQLDAYMSDCDQERIVVRVNRCDEHELTTTLLRAKGVPNALRFKLDSDLEGLRPAAEGTIARYELGKRAAGRLFGELFEVAFDRGAEPVLVGRAKPLSRIAGEIWVDAKKKREWRALHARMKRAAR